jgi:PAS domain S-box-containing protein
VNDVEVVKELIFAARNGGGFVSYTLPAVDQRYETYEKLSYSDAVLGWGWYIGAGTSLQTIQEELAENRKQFVWRFIKYIAFALGILLIISASSFVLIRRVVINITRNVDSLSDSFENASVIGAKLTSEDATYTEFERVKDSANQMISFQQKARHVESVLLEINQHSQTPGSLNDLLESIHQIMHRELGAENFFVALINEEKDTLEFQYCVDSTIKECPTVERISDPNQKRLSLYPIRKNEQILLSKADMEQLQGNGALHIHGELPETWLGVPLKVQGATIGVMVIQDYNKPNSYSWMDQQLIGACAEQIALGVERKRSEIILAQAKSEFESIFNNSQVGIMLLRGGHLLYRGNQRLADILGYRSPDEMVGLSMLDLHLNEENFIKFGDKYFNKLREESQIQVDYQLRRKDGNPVWCSISGKALKPNNLDEGVVWVVDDLEPRKTMEEQLIKIAEVANEASRAKSEFLANMSHEIRTPMNGVLGMLQLLQTTALDTEQDEYVLTAIQSSKRLTQLLSDILDLSRVEAGKLVIADEPYNLIEVLQQAIELFKPTADQAGLTLDLQIPSGMAGHVSGDPYRLQQILANLIGNALKFTQQGGVTLAVEPMIDSPIGRNVIRFAVSDTGCGIPEDRIEALFFAFTQVDEGFSRKYQGAGLGLAICKRLVELMGGEIRIESQLGKGTTVSFDLSLEPTPIEEIEPASVKEEGSHYALSILLVEDDRVSSISATRLMEKLGCAVSTAMDGIQALERLRENRFDVVFMDIQMPRMDGVEATKAIRDGQAGQENASIPIVALTAYAMAGDKETFLEEGMDDYLSKPLDASTLEKALGKLSALISGHK